LQSLRVIILEIVEFLYNQLPESSLMSPKSTQHRIRYAVVGLGHIAQAAVLPAFQHATKNSTLTALVSDDPEKLRTLGKRYRVEHTYSYEEYADCLHSGNIDAVYITLPNDMHRDYTVAAAQAGIHVLCEKPMALTEAECEEMIRACADNNVKLMIAYRLHFERANLEAIRIAKSGTIGNPRIFSSVFTMQVKDPDNIRLKRERGGGTLYDIGIYCINAARNLFGSEPVEVSAFSVWDSEQRFQEVDEMTSFLMRFPGDRLASVVCSFGASDVSTYRIVGTKGDLRVDPAYEYQGELVHTLTVRGTSRKKSFRSRDQFAPELLRFSESVIHKKAPEPSGEEGLADVRVIRAVYESASRGSAVRLREFQKQSRPSLEQETFRPPVEQPSLVNVRPPH
jgi:predicted dehydrogenase